MSAGAGVAAAGVVDVEAGADGVCAIAAVANNADPANALNIYFAIISALPSVKIFGTNTPA